MNAWHAIDGKGKRRDFTVWDESDEHVVRSGWAVRFETAWSGFMCGAVPIRFPILAHDKGDLVVVYTDVSLLIVTIVYLGGVTRYRVLLKAQEKAFSRTTRLLGCSGP